MDGERPQVYFVPAAGEPPELSVLLKPLTDGRRSLLVYTSLARFVAGCGADRRWAAVPGERIPAVVTASGADVVVLDADLPALGAG